jgi:uncharacterized protein
LQPDNQNIALLLFTRTPDEEVRYKNLLPQSSVAKQKAVVAKLIQESRQVLDKTGLPYFICTSAEQVGATFAERFYGAFAGLFAKGFQHVIAIGNDCPQLKPNDILKAAACLQRQEVVVGPDNSGGVYLLGLSNAAFNACGSFAGIRWSTNQVLSDLAVLFRLTEAALRVLPKYCDLNNHRDLHRALSCKYFRAPVILFLKYLLNLLVSYKSLRQVYIIPAFHHSSLFFRGPPSRY